MNRADSKQPTAMSTQGEQQQLPSSDKFGGQRETCTEHTSLLSIWQWQSLKTPWKLGGAGRTMLLHLPLLSCCFQDRAEGTGGC